MSEEIKDWRDVCRKLLELDAAGVAEPWREFEWSYKSCHWTACDSLGELWNAANKTQHFMIRLKPRTVRVTTHDGEVLELPEPWWDVPDGTPCYYVDPLNYVKKVTLFEGSVTARTMRSCGNVFRTWTDAQAWADAMPRIKGAKRHE